MKLYLKLLLIIPLFLSCMEKKLNYLEIKIRGIENCVQIIKINQDGNGVFLRGQTEGVYKSKSHEIYTTELTKKFFIKDKEVLSFLNLEIKKLNDMKKKDYGFVLGGQRYILNINGKEIVDSYGSKSNEVHSVLKKIFPFLPEKLVYNC